ncbi:MAG: sigma-54-dependent Fis family transcriptional regulator [Kiritimatiellae bacterium]|nr:sigma-54-dependent Fis family transcriptional regulator [Kiritimatiellia bacterium]
MAKPKILIVDDEKPTRDVMARILGASYECITAPDGEIALETLAANPDTALLVTDYRMPGMNGIDLVRKAKESHPSLAAILVTAFGEIDLAVEAMKDGADDFLTKPITDLRQMELRVAKAIERHALMKRVETLEQELGDGGAIGSFTGSSPAMEKVYRLIRKVAPTDATVLVEGPSGSGKELTARAIHDLSRRKDGPFVAVECASLPPTLLESELFGAVKGAYTGAIDRAGCFETANGGTLFLDEIGEIREDVQVKLLRVLETHTFQRVGEAVTRKSDFRLIVATNRNLARLAAEGKFREDLYYRLNVIEIRTPALSEHREDIAPLAKRFVKEFAAANGTAVTGIDAKAIRVLEDYSWPGNVRQLRNAIERMVVLSSGGRLTVDDIPEEIADAAAAKPAQAAGTATPPEENGGEASLAETEKAKILAVLAESRNNKSEAARRLGISRRTLHRKIKEWSSE